MLHVPKCTTIVGHLQQIRKQANHQELAELPPNGLRIQVAKNYQTQHGRLAYMEHGAHDYISSGLLHETPPKTRHVLPQPANRMVL